LQERFLLIQSGLQDEHDELLDEIDMMEHYCEETKNTLQAQIANNQALMKTCETKLAEATENEATSSEKGRTTAAEHEQLDAQLRRTMGTCSKHYIDLEGQICALKKIRAEIYKMKGATGSVILFQDCTVSKWTPLECTSECGGGTQLVQRTVMIPPNGEDLQLAALPHRLFIGCLEWMEQV
jgi:predicted RNase H-like nuclease (RuvC/YqgF family)